MLPEDRPEVSIGTVASAEIPKGKRGIAGEVLDTPDPAPRKGVATAGLPAGFTGFSSSELELLLLLLLLLDSAGSTAGFCITVCLGSPAVVPVLGSAGLTAEGSGALIGMSGVPG